MKVGDRVRIKHALYPGRHGEVVEYVKGLDWPWLVAVRCLIDSKCRCERIHFTDDELEVISG